LRPHGVGRKRGDEFPGIKTNQEKLNTNREGKKEKEVANVWQREKEKRGNTPAGKDTSLGSPGSQEGEKTNLNYASSERKEEGCP